MTVKEEKRSASAAIENAVSHPEELVDTVADYVSDRPVKSVIGALLVGVILGKFFI